MSPPPPPIQVDYPSKTATLGGTTLKEGDWLSLNGSSGEVLQGKQPVKPPEMSGAWAPAVFACRALWHAALWLERRGAARRAPQSVALVLIHCCCSAEPPNLPTCLAPASVASL